MKTLKLICYAAALAFVTPQANAVVSYDWITTHYTGAGEFALSEIFSINMSWTLADAAVERGRVQLIGSDPDQCTEQTQSRPEEIIDFSFAAQSLDGSRAFTFDKFDTGIRFTLPRPCYEAWHDNMRIRDIGPTIHGLNLRDLDSGFAFHLWSASDLAISLPGESFAYTVNGYWQRREVPEPGSIALMLGGLIGLAWSRRRAVNSRHPDGGKNRGKIHE